MNLTPGIIKTDMILSTAIVVILDLAIILLLKKGITGAVLITYLFCGLGMNISWIILIIAGFRLLRLKKEIKKHEQ